MPSTELIRTGARRLVLAVRACAQVSPLVGSGIQCDIVCFANVPRRWGHNGPSDPNNRRSTPWERKAVQVKNTDVNNPYLELIRETHDPSMQLKTLEDELKSTIGKALGKQGEKILYALQRMQNGYAHYEKALEDNGNVAHHPVVVQCANQYNRLRQEAIQARWELMVHRQAIGLIVNNQKYVMKHYPIGDAIPITNIDKNVDPTSYTTNEKSNVPSSNSKNEGGQQKPKAFGDQRSWWETIGRWR